MKAPLPPITRKLARKIRRTFLAYAGIHLHSVRFFWGWSPAKNLYYGDHISVRCLFDNGTHFSMAVSMEDIKIISTSDAASRWWSHSVVLTAMWAESPEGKEYRERIQSILNRIQQERTTEPRPIHDPRI